MDFQLMDNVNMTAEKDLAQIQKNKKGGAYIASHMAIYYSKQRLSLPPRWFNCYLASLEWGKSRVRSPVGSS